MGVSAEAPVGVSAEAPDGAPLEAGEALCRGLSSVTVIALSFLTALVPRLV
ncbi:hypothetical protein [Streptomyces aureocirculatus]|uniref:hypothetical protein n=1 Tax=Streptomyces aureocirculatus TaxID=67275 RepID=UPI0012FF16C0|nr:hypothetical protein [Streptomyces aureocirculatus]